MRLFNTLATFAVIGLVLVGCGRKIGLDTPYEAAVDARKQAQREDKPLPPEPTPPVTDRPFFLDRLID